MAIQFIGVETVSNSAGSNATDLTVDVPTGITDGDLLIAAVYGDDAMHSAGGPDAPVGWTSLGSKLQGFEACWVWWRIANSEPGSYLWQNDTGASWGAGIIALHGVNTASPIMASGSVGRNTQNPNGPSVTTTGAAMIVTFIGSGSGNTTRITFSTTEAGTEAADWGLHQGTFAHSGALFYKSETASAAYQYKINMSSSSDGNNEAVLFGIAVAPETGADGEIQLSAPAPAVEIAGGIKGEGPLALSAPLPALDVSGVSNLIYGDWLATAPTPTVFMATGVDVSATLAVTAPLPAARIDALRDLFATVEITAPSPGLGVGAETRITGARRVIVKAESRVLYP